MNIEPLKTLSGAVVAIDGPAGVGKSTIAKYISEELGYYFVNSGNFYRAVTYISLERGIHPEATDSIIKVAKVITYSIIEGKLAVDGSVVEEFLHTDAVDAWVAQHSAIIPIREVVNENLRKLAKDGLNIVCEGRDITTVVFPEAQFKFFLDASPRVRAERRFNQQDTRYTLDEIEQKIKERDVIDRNKEFGALKIAHDATYIDSSYLTIDEVYVKVLQAMLDHVLE